MENSFEILQTIRDFDVVQTFIHQHSYDCFDQILDHHSCFPEIISNLVNIDPKTGNTIFHKMALDKTMDATILQKIIKVVKENMDDQKVNELINHQNGFSQTALDLALSAKNYKFRQFIQYFLKIDQKEESRGTFIVEFDF